MEKTQVVVIGGDSPLHRGLVSAVVKVLADIGEDASSTAYIVSPVALPFFMTIRQDSVVVEHVSGLCIRSSEMRP